MKALKDEALEKVAGGGETVKIPEKEAMLMNGLCCHCGRKLLKLLDMTSSLGSDASFLCLHCGHEFEHHVVYHGNVAEYWMDNGVKEGFEKPDGGLPGGQVIT